MGQSAGKSIPLCGAVFTIAGESHVWAIAAAREAGFTGNCFGRVAKNRWQRGPHPPGYIRGGIFTVADARRHKPRENRRAMYASPSLIWCQPTGV
jgi:hypothetical protein